MLKKNINKWTRVWSTALFPGQVVCVNKTCSEKHHDADSRMLNIEFWTGGGRLFVLGPDALGALQIGLATSLQFFWFEHVKISRGSSCQFYFLFCFRGASPYFSRGRLPQLRAARDTAVSGIQALGLQGVQCCRSPFEGEPKCLIEKLGCAGNSDLVGKKGSIHQVVLYTRQKGFADLGDHIVMPSSRKFDFGVRGDWLDHGNEGSPFLLDFVSGMHFKLGIKIGMQIMGPF